MTSEIRRGGGELGGLLRSSAQLVLLGVQSFQVHHSIVIKRYGFQGYIKPHYNLLLNVIYR